jgi:DNA modification methylase
LARPRSQTPHSAITNVRLTETERSEMEITASARGFASISEYIRHLHKNSQAEQSPTATIRPHIDVAAPRIFHEVTYGKIYHGDALGLLHKTLKPKGTNLIVTSPPFGLVRKKSYGNEDADRYVDWFRPFAEGFKRVLKDDGSLVIDIGGAWKPGIPTRSLYHFELLMMLCKEYGFHLCLEHYWWNPAKLPTPAEWVNIRRVRVKDAVNCIWWLSPNPFPKASNKRVLAPYSESMNGLIANGYKAKLRPSGHNISAKFQRHNGGAIPPNLLAIANTESNGKYQEYCKEHGIDPHPARFPSALPEYFVKFLTDPGDLVIDPFGGSCVTGEVCESLKRKWVCCELQAGYLEGARARFGDGHVRRRPPSTSYRIDSPCSLPIREKDAPLVADGGRKRPPLVRTPTQQPILNNAHDQVSYAATLFE